MRAGGVVRWPYGAAETAPVDDRDVAAVVARTLDQDGHAGGDYVLTGPESLSQAEQVGISVTSWGVGSRSRSCCRTSFEARRREAGRARRWTCCSPPGAQRSEGRRSSPLRCPTSSDRRRDRFASGPPITPPRSWKAQPHRIDLRHGPAPRPRSPRGPTASPLGSPWHASDRGGLECWRADGAPRFVALACAGDPLRTRQARRTRPHTRGHPSRRRHPCRPPAASNQPVNNAAR